MRKRASIAVQTLRRVWAWLQEKLAVHQLLAWALPLVSSVGTGIAASLDRPGWIAIAACVAVGSLILVLGITLARRRATPVLCASDARRARDAVYAQYCAGLPSVTDRDCLETLQLDLLDLCPALAHVQIEVALPMAGGPMLAVDPGAFLGKTSDVLSRLYPIPSNAKSPRSAAGDAHIHVSTLRINDTAKYEGFMVAGDASDRISGRAASLVCVPLVDAFPPSGRKSLGVLCVGTTVLHVWSDQEVRLIERYAAALAVRYAARAGRTTAGAATA